MFNINLIKINNPILLSRSRLRFQPICAVYAESKRQINVISAQWISIYKKHWMRWKCLLEMSFMAKVQVFCPCTHTRDWWLWNDEDERATHTSTTIRNDYDIDCNGLSNIVPLKKLTQCNRTGKSLRIFSHEVDKTRLEFDKIPQKKHLSNYSSTFVQSK